MPVNLYKIISYLVFLSLPLVATFKGKGTVLLDVALALLHFKTFWKNRLTLKDQCLKTLRTPLGLWAAGFTVWAMASALWAPNTGKALWAVGRYVILVSVGFLFIKTLTFETEEKIGILKKAFTIGFIVYILFFLSEIYLFPLASMLYTYSNHMNKTLFIKGIVTLGFFFWAFLMSQKHRFFLQNFRRSLLLCLMILAFVFIPSRPDAALVGMILGGVGALIAYTHPRIVHIAAALFTLFALSAPWLMKHEPLSTKMGDAQYYMPPSYQHRVHIWEEMSKKALEKPMIGHGFDYSTSLSGGKTYESFQIKPYFNKALRKFETKKIFHKPVTIFSSHPHNGIIQIWVELGGLGVLLFLGILWSLSLLISSLQDSKKRACAFGLLLFYEIIHLVGFGLWQKWICASIILSLMGCALNEMRRKS